MKKYPSIELLRVLIKEVRLNHDYKGRDEQGNPIYINTDKYPTLNFTGTVKLHGTNSSIVKYKDGRIEYTSKERVLSLDEDNNNFMNEMVKRDLSVLFKDIVFNESCILYGEWCGKGIQKGVAVNMLPKMFVIFGIRIDDKWVDLPVSIQDNSNNIYNILQFPTYNIEIDFNNPKLSLDKINEITNSVEQSCPVGKFFGVDGFGEGIVFTCVENKKYRFKSKGVKFSVVKQKKQNAVDIELINSINEFVDIVVTENRLEQGISVMNTNNIDISIKNTGYFLKWIVSDIFKEENDTILENGFDEKKINKAISSKSREWFIKKVDNITFN